MQIVQPRSRPRDRVGTPASRPAVAVCALQAPALAAGLYLLVLLAASRLPGTPWPPSTTRHTFLVLVPAHNEEKVIGRTLASVAALDYPPEQFEVIVVADNCDDATADVVRATGTRVIERRDPDRRGKGYALAWALETLDLKHDAVVIIDADCVASGNLLAEFDRGLEAGAEAMQASYLDADASASNSAALRHAALLLYNHLRPLGKERLGLSVGLGGTGMCFSSSLLRRRPWRAFSFAEDREYHVMLVDAGTRVRFIAEAEVRSPMTVSGAQARSQSARWDSGRLRLGLKYGPRLVARGIRTRDRVALEVGIDPLLPPQSLLLAMNLAGAALALASRRKPPVMMAMASLAAQSSFVVGGLVSVGATADAWRGLRHVPAFFIGRMATFAELATGRGPTEWSKTERPEPV
jgi:1,2-diacylglycerol 3-beta-glucosyltransferase